jgi:NAD(P)H dehydrogenase (quinone)
MIVVTGASGQLGRLVIEGLLKKVPAESIAAVVRNPAQAEDLAARGVQVRQGDYDQPETLARAFEGADKLLLISGNAVGRRLPQHRAAIEAAKAAGVKLIAYTSLLHANTSPLPLAAEHKATEALLAASSLPYVLLRNSWYIENHMNALPVALQHGVVLGSAGDGKFSSAARADYAAAAVEVLTRENQAGKIYELAGDQAYTLAELAAEFARQSGKAVAYQDMPEADFKAALAGAGLPDYVATMLAESDVGASKGGLFDGASQLCELIRRPTTTLAAVVEKSLPR